ncbi:Similar to Mitochondrial group I intron splicing factor CCM1; acc. no. C4R5P7 [Pyronema omphalodes CBS 100304]|uniref:Similar to Mitochondrial group I intron splicing factor CCM1 acc. no. C4R5P7 n=1 Tax=Pyronema omphalodes (strain CBS 100304) TaxID=1076935 RepID=U4LP04_PYROM|nr:Similar to Mitochondrial group I intron splicing factor CCM1; acc. no. C4R5P7 [Pyronema omphalodes CBS 100304]
MFRNGLTAARRPVISQSLGAAQHNTTTAATAVAVNNFVCKLCQTKRSAHDGPRKDKKKDNKTRKQETFAEQVKRLEQHVQMMERNYVEMLRKRAQEQMQPKGEIPAEITDQAYQSLMAPVAPESLFLPEPESTEDKLPEKVKERLGESLALVQMEEPEWEAIIGALEEKGGFEGMTSEDVVGLLKSMPAKKRVVLSSQLLEMAKKAEVLDNAMIYDGLMMAHNYAGNSEVVEKMFADLQERGIKPTVYTYGHLLKAYSQTKNVAAAAQAFQEMQAAGIEPNLIVYTSLIQTCINRQEFDTAWQIFNLMKLKSTATAPDVATYSLMIHACAVKGEAERALDLFTDMTVRKELVPTEYTYQSIIHACAVRKDYFGEAWKYARIMQEAGLPITIMVFNVLLQACGVVGELTRARLLLRHMSESGNPDIYPNKFTFQNALRAYSNYQAPKNQRTTRNSILEKMNLQKQGKWPPPPEPNAKEAETINYDADAGTWIPAPQAIQQRNIKDTDKIPFLNKPILGSRREILDEAALIINWLRESKPDIMDTQLMNSYLDVAKSQGYATDFIESYRNDYENPPVMFRRPEPKTPKPEEEAAEEDAFLQDLPKLQRNIQTYHIALQGAVRFRDLEFAKEVFKDRQQFCNSLQYRKISHQEREKYDFEAEKLFIHALALKGLLADAMERVMILYKERRVKWEWNHLAPVYVMAVKLEDTETATTIRALTGRIREEEDIWLDKR